MYEKERSNGGKLEFYVTETDWKDAETGDPVLKAIFTLVINVRPSSTAGPPGSAGPSQQGVRPCQ